MVETAEGAPVISARAAVAKSSAARHAPAGGSAAHRTLQARAIFTAPPSSVDGVGPGLVEPGAGSHARPSLSRLHIGQIEAQEREAIAHRAQGDVARIA